MDILFFIIFVIVLYVIWKGYTLFRGLDEQTREPEPKSELVPVYKTIYTYLITTKEGHHKIESPVLPEYKDSWVIFRGHEEESDVYQYEGYVEYSFCEPEIVEFVKYDRIQIGERVEEEDSNG